MSTDNLPPELREQSTAQAETEGTPEDRALFDQLADAVRKHKARERAAHRAEVLREAADALDESKTLRDLTDDHMHDVHAAANELRRMADETAPPSALRTAHAALAEQAGRDQAAIERVRQVLAPYDWLHAQIPAASIRAALDPQEPTRPATADQPAAYSDGKGNARIYCLACPRPADVDVPLTINAVDHWDLCRSCGRHVVDVARATEETSR